MKSFLTFDYELFFGSNSGSLEKCIIEPTRLLLNIAKKHSNKLVFFVDAGYLMALNKFKNKYKTLEKDLINISLQLDLIVSNGHDIQLHIHPHWQDSFYDGNKWVFNTERYKLDSFTAQEVVEICTSYKAILTQYANEDDIFAYRAGGWCIQPFDKISTGLKAAKIWLDSTVYKDGFNVSATKGFDFRNACSKEIWKFESDPLTEDLNGSFVELPISNTLVSPNVYWKVALNKLLKSNKHKSIGDGMSLGSGSEQVSKLLTQKTIQPIFLDGIKSASLWKSYQNFKLTNKEFFVAIGHPKAMSRFSLKNIDFLMNDPQRHFSSFKNETTSLQNL